MSDCSCQKQDGYANCCRAKSLEQMIENRNTWVDYLTKERDALRAAQFAYASEFDGDEGSIHQNIKKLKQERDALRAQLESIKRFKSPGYLSLLDEAEAVADERDKLRAALEQIASHEGMTNLGSCCVDKTCVPYYDDGKKVAHCSFGFGVNRGFGECAGTAREALNKKD